MFEQRNVIVNVHRIAEAEDGETVYAVEFFCEKCGHQLDSPTLDLWLTRIPFLALTCMRCGEHLVIDFIDFDGQVDALISQQV